VDPEDLRRLESASGRRARSAGKLLRGDLEGWYWDRALHTRLVQLALVEGRMRSERDAGRRAETAEEADALRTAVVAARMQRDRGAGPRGMEVAS
jgi:hypothetical protein